MYYIQTYKQEKTKNDNHNKNKISQVLDADYMGSAEFEFGTVGKSYRHIAANLQMKLHFVQAQSKGGKNSLVDFFVLADDEGIDHFKKEIEKHLDGTRIGRISKERTNLWEKFNSSRESDYYPDFWFSVDRYVYSSETEPVIAFSHKKDLVITFFLYFALGNETENHNFAIGDEVYCAESFLYKEPKKFLVCGLNEDETITLKFHGKKVRKFSKFVYPVELIEKTNMLERMKIQTEEKPQ